MAGVFFKSIDGVIANGIPEKVTAAVAAAAPAVAVEGAPVVSGAVTAPAVLPAGVPAAGGTDARTVMVSAVVGAAIALSGVAIGGFLARSGCRE